MLNSRDQDSQIQFSKQVQMHTKSQALSKVLTGALVEAAVTKGSMISLPKTYTPQISQDNQRR